MDDLLKSLPKEDVAVSMIVRDLSEIRRLGGFNLTKWISNKCNVFQHVPEEHRSKTVEELDLDRDKLPVERALGLH